MTLAQLIQQERLPADFTETVDRYYRPLAERVAAGCKEKPDQSILLGINGGQGTGKSTMALFLRHLLEKEHELKVAVLSIDDLYLTREERIRLGEKVHPLLKTRGVPGTHDPQLGLEVIEKLMQAGAGEETPLPRFNKAVDDRVPEEEWPVFEGRADVVILEGWCVGATPQPDAAIIPAANPLEEEEDAEAIWRRHVNDQLAGPYRPLFERIDALILLKAPSMACIRAWRGEQEDKLREKMKATGGDMSQVMDEAQLDRFIAHYQRLTEHQWQVLPMTADAVLELGEDHRIKAMNWKEGS